MAAPLTPDLCVIGAGSSGLAVAFAARRLGADVVMVERGVPGGESLRSGALATEALAAAAAQAHAIRRGAAFGVGGEEPKVNFRKLHDHIAEVIAQAAPDSSAARLEALGIELVRGSGAFKDPSLLAVGAVEIRARRFVIATGARSVIPDVPGLLSVPYFTSETIFDNTRKLTHLVIVGAGPAGLGIGLSYRRLGCAVTIVEPGPVLPGSDPELAGIALRRLLEDGVTLLPETEIVTVQSRSQGIGVVVRARGETSTLDASHILVASGRTANLEDLGLDLARIRRAKADPAALDLSTSLRTTNRRVYAVGEAAGHAPAAHLATLGADIVVRAALLGQGTRYDAAAVPRLTLTDPEIAEIGLTEPLARARFGDNFQVFRAAFGESDKARATREAAGVLKLVATRSGRILGAGIVGPGAGELAALVGLALAQNLGVTDLASFVAPYPSHAELLRRLGEAALAPSAPSGLDKRRFALMRLLR